MDFKKKFLLILLACLVFFSYGCQVIPEKDDVSGITSTQINQETTEEITLYISEEISKTNSEETSIEDSVTDELTSSKETTAVEETTPEETTSEEITSEETKPEETTSEEITSEETTSEETASETETAEETSVELPPNPAKDFYGDAIPAGSYEEALERSDKGEISGALTVPDQAPTISEYRPMVDGVYIRNNEPYFIDENTYVVVDAYGREVLRIYRGGGYITLEEVAAYLYAFGDIPANYTSSKRTKPEQSIWGIYLRLNHTKFSGNTEKYPYEPELPRISGCGGDLTYYEIDIGTTGTDCDPAYRAAIYNNGVTITRGAARIVYTRFDANGDSIIDPNEKFLFYTYNHYNDFREYLNYFGGWGEMFGNVTGGGKLSSKTDYNPTPYITTVMASIGRFNEELNMSVNEYVLISFILPEDLYYTRKINVL